jgi:carbamate kinase
MRPGERGTAAEQRANLREACEALRPLLGENELVITHGNGPQVGNELLRHERGAEEVPPLPLYLAVAQTQAEIGALIESELAPVASRPVACLLTHVVVDENDPAFDEPTKPIGPFYDEAKARELERDRGWQVVHDSGRGWRRVVPSPLPLDVVELDSIRSLLRGGAIAIACGGGGIPVAQRNGRLAGLDAVIDKDRASSLLARALGADRLVILTEVPAVYRNFGTDKQEELRELRAEEAEALLAELAAGSMRPKVEASVEFARATGHQALITSPSALGEALSGEAGTLIVS